MGRIAKKAIKKKQQAEPSEEKLLKGDIQLWIAKILCHENVPGPKFPRTFRVVRMSTGVVLAEELEDKVVKRLDGRDVIEESLTKYLAARDDRNQITRVDIDGIQKAVRYWISYAEPIEDVTNFRWANEPSDRYTWHKLPIRRLPEQVFPLEAYPTWSEIFSRIQPEDNADAAMQWIGSLFSECQDRQQYLWLYGKGTNSKSRMIAVLSRILGPTCDDTLEPPEKGQRKQEDWASRLLGVNLGIFPDCNNSRWPESGLFKRLTGGDQISGRFLYSKPFKFRPNLRILFSTNNPPQVGNTEANRRRAIICEIAKISGEQISEAVYEKKLMDEAEMFINAALQSYEKCGSGHIRTDQDVLEEYASTMNSEVEHLFDKYFEEDPEGHVVPHKMEEILQKERSQGVDIIRFREWLIKEKDVKKRKVRRNEMDEFGYKLGCRLYRGIRLKKEF